MGIYAALGVASGLFTFALSLNIRQAQLEDPQRMCNREMTLSLLLV